MNVNYLIKLAGLSTLLLFLLACFLSTPFLFLYLKSLIPDYEAALIFDMVFVYFGLVVSIVLTCFSISEVISGHKKRTQDNTNKSDNN